MSDRYRLHESMGYQLSLAARTQQRRMEDGLRPLGLSRTFWAILVTLAFEEPDQPSDIADHLGIDRTATSRALRRMEAEGLIARDTGNGDGRTRRVVLTNTGQATLDRAIPVARDSAAAIDALLSAEEQDTLRRLLRKLTAGTDARPRKL